MYSYRVYKCSPKKDNVIAVDFRTRTAQVAPCIRSSREMVSEGWISVEYAKKWADENIRPPYTYEIRRYWEEETRFTRAMAGVHPRMLDAAVGAYKPAISGIADSGIPEVESMKLDKTRQDVLDIIWKIGRRAFGGTVSKGKRYMFVAGEGFRELQALTDSEINHYLEVMYIGKP